MSLFKAENMKLKDKVTELENRLINLAGSFKIFSSGMQGREHELNNQIANIIMGAKAELKIVTPYITQDYVLLLQDRAKNGIKVQIVLNDRRFWENSLAQFYDTLKITPNISLINNPNVKYLLVWTPEVCLFASGPLDKGILSKTILIGTLVLEKLKIDECLGIFKEMLPSFMR